MRRRRQQLSEAESIHILEKATPVAHWLFWEMAAIPTPFPSVMSMPMESCISTVPCGHKVDALRACDKASFCVIEQDCVQPKEYTTYFRSVIAFGRAHIIEDESEKLETARMLGHRYNPNDEESLQKEIEHGLPYADDTFRH